MGNVVQRWKKLRLRWKLIPLVLLAGLIGFIWWARLPWYEVRMTEVVPYEGHPDWLEVRFEVENLRGREFGIMVEEGSSIANGNLYCDGFPELSDGNWIAGYYATDSSGNEHPISISGIDFPPGKTLFGRTLIHNELGSLRVRGYFHVYSKRSSFHGILGERLNEFAQPQHKFTFLNRVSSIVRNWGNIVLFPEIPSSISFVPNVENAGTAGPTLVRDCKLFFNEPLPPTLAILPETGFWKFVHDFASSNGENVGSKIDYDNWEEELLPIIDSAGPNEKAYLETFGFLVKRVVQTRGERLVRKKIESKI